MHTARATPSGSVRGDRVKSLPKRSTWWPAERSKVNSSMERSWGDQAGAGRPTILAISARAERARASSPEVAKARLASEAVRARDNTAVARAGSAADPAPGVAREPAD